MKFNGIEFCLTENFINKFKGKQPNWGPLGYFTYKRSYAQTMENGKVEEFWQTLQRVVEGTYLVQKIHCSDQKISWDNRKAQISAQEMYQRMWDFKFLPPGRGLEHMGRDLIFTYSGAMLQNCGFVSTKNIDTDFSNPFKWLMEMSLLGVGVGFDTLGAEKDYMLKEPRTASEPHIIEDSREGWVAAFSRILDAYVGADTLPKEFDYSQIRAAGEPIKRFGGIAPGPGPLKTLISKTKKLLNNYLKHEKPVDSTFIVDLMNFAGEAVVAGGRRRTAEIAFGHPDDEDFLNLKIEKHRNDQSLARWASNNSISAEIGMDYSKFTENIARDGEPGFLWLDNAKKYGRMVDGVTNADYRALGTNPCGEQTLEDQELCVSGDTRIQTKHGAPKIKSVIGQEVEVWNGKEWSKVIPFKTSEKSKLLRIHFSDGSYLDCTKYHRFKVRARTRKHFITKKASDLCVNDILPSFNLQHQEGKYDDNAYEYGMFEGDGYFDFNTPYISVQEKCMKACSPNGVLRKSYKPKGYSEAMQRCRLSQLDFEICKKIKDEIPDEVFSWDKESILQFTAGVIDTDGSIGNKGKLGEYYRVYGTEGFLRDLQLLLRRANINSTGLKLFAKAGAVTNKGVRSKDLWMLNIHSYQCDKIPTRYRKVNNVSSGLKQNPRYNNTTISNVKTQKVLKIEELSGEPTYCFYERFQGMGVFGNVLTYQCNLVETFPSKHEDLKDYLRTLKFAYLYAKTVTLVKTHDIKTNSVMLRNRRIGLSQSGIVEAITKTGFREYINWCDKGYEEIRQWDKLYSDWLCVSRSIKVTSVKPSGSVSLLPGVPPGIHFPHSEYYIRRVQVSKTSHLWKAMQEAGYKVVPLKTQADYTMVVEFPVHETVPRSKYDVSMLEQLELAAQLQYWWSDNQVSITVTLKPEEKEFLSHVLPLYETRLKSVSFLPINPNVTYEQAPYETITKREFLKRTKSLKKPKLHIEEEDKIHERFCDGEVCEL